MIHLTVNADMVGLVEESAPLVRRLSDKVARAAPDPDDTATAAYVFMRRLVSKMETTDIPFEFVASNEAAYATVNELKDFFRKFPAERARLRGLLGALHYTLQKQREEIREAERAERRRTARRGRPSVREQRGLHRQGK